MTISDSYHAPDTKDILELILGLDGDPEAKELIGLLGNFFDLFAQVLNRRDPDKLLECVPGSYGYLHTCFDNWDIYVPWALVTSFPTRDDLNSLVRIAEQISIPGKTSIAISGSANFLGAQIAISDLDFAQYYFDDAQLFASQAKVSVQSQFQNLRRIKLWNSKEQYFRPWCEFVHDVDRHCDANPFLAFKFDHCDPCTDFGMVPISNLVMLSDPPASASVPTHSFVFQEAILVGQGMKPWPLIMAEGFVSYIKFLLRDMGKYQATNPAKAAKRALSLARYLRCDKIASRIEGQFRTAADVALAANKARLDDAKSLLSMGNDRPAALVGALEEFEAELKRAGASNGRTSLAKVFEGEISDLTNQINQVLWSHGIPSLEQWTVQ